MWFLLIQIIFFMCLAAGLGALAAWWWLRRRFVDVTETHAELTRQVEGALAEGRVLTREDVRGEVQSALAAYRPPEPDFAAILRRLDSLDATLSAPDAQLDTITGRLGNLEHTFSGFAPALSAAGEQQAAQLDDRTQQIASRIETGIERLSEQVRANTPPDIAPILQRIDALETRIAGIKLPEIDLGPVHSGLARLDLTLSELNIPEVDLGPLAAQISGMEAVLTGEVAAVRDRVEDIELPPPADLTPIYNRLAELDIAVSDRIAQIETRLTATAPINEALISTLAGMEADLNVVAARRGPDIMPVYDQLAALDAALASLRGEFRLLPRSDEVERRFSSLQDKLAAAAAAAPAPPPLPDISRADLIALEDRLTAIEYGLTALHHMLRARSEPPRTEPAVNGSSHASAPPPPAAPAPPVDPVVRARRAQAIAAARKPDDEANLLTHAAFGEGDELSQIIGVGPILTELLHEVGVFYFWQIAEWSEEDISYVDGKLLHFRGRIERDDWVGQARELSAQPGAARRPGAA